MAIRLSDAELEGLAGLSDLQFRCYVAGLRPRMDYRTGVAGRATRLSYQALTEAVEEVPGPGRKARPKPSKDQVYRLLQALERQGLIELIGAGRELVVKFLLADFDEVTNSSAQKKAATNPRQTRDESRDKPEIRNHHPDNDLPETSVDNPRQDFEDLPPKAATPPESGTGIGGGGGAPAREEPQGGDPQHRAIFAGLRTELSRLGWSNGVLLSPKTAPVIHRWASEGVSPQDLADATTEARNSRALNGALPTSPAYLVRIVERIVQARQNPTPEGVTHETRVPVRERTQPAGSKFDRIMQPFYAGAFAAGPLDPETRF